MPTRDDDAAPVPVDGDSRRQQTSSSSAVDKKRRRPTPNGIWDPSVVKPPVARPRIREPSLESSRAVATAELALYKQVKRVRSELTRMLGGNKGGEAAGEEDAERRPQQQQALLVYERWLARASLVEGGLAAPLLPAIDAEGGLKRDLIRHGASEEDAARDAKAAARRAGEAASRWEKCRRGEGEDGDGLKVEDIVVRDSGSFIHLQLGSLKPYVKVTKTHLGKLRALWCRACRRGQPLSSNINSDEYKTFAYRVFALLMRYESLGGSGYQAALGEDAFDALKSNLGVSCEVFASPLNCRYGSFCSQFFDMDKYFGSLGSFFSDKFEPTRGSFEMNPPFVPETISKAVDKAESLLRRARESEEPLSFVVVVPAWKECKFWQALSKSEFLRIPAADIIAAEDHGFVDGAQHSRPARERHRVSSYDTGVFYLQSPAAADAWTCTKTVRNRVLEKMKTAVGTCKNVKELEERYRHRGGGGKRPKT